MNVLIIGAGPAGAGAAIALAQRGVRNVLLLDRARFPRDKTCGSAISPLGLRVLRALGVADEVRGRGLPVHTLRLTTPGGRQLTMRGSEAAVILLRKELDHLLVERARAFGVTFRDGTAVTGLIEDGGRVVGVRVGDEEIRADYVICADGAHSRFSADPRPRRTLGTIMGWWENVDFEPGTVEMLFDPVFTPLYGWLFPETPTRVNIGIVVDGHRFGGSGDLGNARAVFDAFLRRHFAGRLRSADAVGHWCGHPISYTIVPRYAARPGVLYVGEAARLTNVATGEGIYQALRSGVIAADAVAAVRDGAPERQVLQRYASRSRRTFIPGFLIAQLFRGAVRMGALDVLARTFDHPRVRRVTTWALGWALVGSSVTATPQPK